MTLPVIQAAPGCASTAIVEATSVGVVMRPLGLRRFASLISCSWTGIFRSAGVSVTPARMALPRMPVGGVDVEERGLPPRRFDPLYDLAGERKGLGPVEVDAKDVHAASSELSGRGSAETTGRAEDEGPALELRGCSHGHAPRAMEAFVGGGFYIRRKRLGRPPWL